MLGRSEAVNTLVEDEELEEDGLVSRHESHWEELVVWSALLVQRLVSIREGQAWNGRNFWRVNAIFSRILRRHLRTGNVRIHRQQHVFLAPFNDWVAVQLLTEPVERLLAEEIVIAFGLDFSHKIV